MFVFATKLKGALSLFLFCEQSLQKELYILSKKNKKQKTRDLTKLSSVTVFFKNIFIDSFSGYYV